MSVPIPVVRLKAGSVGSELRLALKDLDTAWPARAKKRLERLYLDLLAEAEVAARRDSLHAVVRPQEPLWGDDRG